MKPNLSILIPSIPSRFARAVELYNDLLAMAEGMNVEIIALTDNKVRSIGAKREALKNLSQGKYFMFVDDDDSITGLDKIYEATFQDVDVIDFKAKCYNTNGSTFIVTQKLGNAVEHTNDGQGNYLDLNRPPFPNCAWNEKFKQFSYPDISYGEDWVWVEQCLKVAKTEIFIDKILFSYNFDISKSEASVESNKFWTNPNHP